jgi:hypothetical protein
VTVAAVGAPGRASLARGDVASGSPAGDGSRGGKGGGLRGSLGVAPADNVAGKRGGLGDRRGGSIGVTTKRSPGNGVGLACGGDRGRSLGGELIVVALAGAESDNDVGIIGARLHSVGVVVGVTVGLLLGLAVLGVGGDLPVAVPGVAVDLAQVVPQHAIVVDGVLVLEDVVEVLVVGELDGPAVAVGELGVLLSVGLVGLEHLVDLLESAAGGRDVAHLDLILAGVLNNGVAEGVGERGAGQKGRGGDHVGDHVGLLSGCNCVN